MAGKLTALLLAILVANPFCCCFAAASGEAEEACCAVALAALAALSDAEEPAPAPTESDPCDPCDPCDCAEGLVDPAALGGEVVAPAPERTLLKEVNFEACDRRFDPESNWSSQISSIAGAWEERMPPGRALAQVHCRYRL